MAITDVNPDTLKLVADEARVNYKSTVLEHVGDVSNVDSNKLLIQLTIKTFGKLDVLVNNAGIGAKDDIFTPNLLDNFDRIFAVNVRGLISLTQEAVNHLVQSQGNIVNVSSAAAFLSTDGMLSYTMSKAAVTRFTRSLAAELGPKGVRVNEVNPAFTKTNIFGSCFQWSKEIEESVYESACKVMPVGKVCEPEDIANSIAFLASNEKAAKVTGHSFMVDGGLVHRQIKM